MNTKTTLSALAFGLSLISQAYAGQTLYTPVDGSFIKNPTSITFQSLGLQLNTASTISLTGPNYFALSMPWYKYQKNLFNFPLSVRPPNNAWITARLADGGTVSSRRLWTAFPYEVKKQVIGDAAAANFYSFPAGYCTNFAARAFFGSPEMNASYAPWKGNAQDWVSNAAKAGWKTTTSTTGGFIGAVIVWKGGGFGHVGIVTDMYQTATPGEISYKIREMNWGAVTNSAAAITVNFGKVTDVTMNSSNLNRSSGFPFIGFILPVRI